MVIDSTSFTEMTSHLQRISQAMLDGMRNIAALNPELAATHRNQQMEWLEAVEAFVQVNQEVLSLAELLRALLDANEDLKQAKAALS